MSVAMPTGLKTRLARLEDRSAPDGRLHVVFGRSDAELDAAADRLLATGEATPRDLIVCIRRFGAEEAADGAHLR